MTRLRSLGISVVLFSMSNISAPAQTSPGGHLQRLFERTGARHRNARRNLEAILRAQPEFLVELNAVAGRLRTDPAWLLNVMACESLFDPDARNPLPGQTASGLLQIIEGTARRLGTTTGAIRRMSPVDQLRLVEKYLGPFKGRLNTLSNVYMAVFRGSIAEGDDTVVVVDSAKEPRVYSLNKSLDINRDKRITKGELGLAALSVGRFLPSPLHKSKGGGAKSSPTPAPRPTRSIYIRRGKQTVIETSPPPANRGG
jgi:transglycosylase-like protein with SLT domain